MKICLFGGTFDPPHIGHLLLAQTIFEEECFDKVLFIPAYQPPHKNNFSPVKDRVNMLKLESYQIEGSFLSTQFYMDIEGHYSEGPVKLAIEELSHYSEEIKILGTYVSKRKR